MQPKRSTESILLPLVLLGVIGCGRTVTVPLPVPTLEMSVDEELTGQLVAASHRITADGSVTLTPGNYKLDKTTLTIVDGTTVMLSGVQVDLESSSPGKVRIDPSDFKIAFSKPVAVANIAVNELKRDSNPVEIEVDLYESFRNLIAVAVADTVSVPNDPTENIVDEVSIETAKVEMRPGATIRLAGLDFHLSEEAKDDSTFVQVKNTNATFIGSDGISRGEGSVALRMLCSVKGDHKGRISFGSSDIEVSGAAAWSVENNSFSASSEQPLVIAVKSLSAEAESLSLKLSPANGNDRFHLVAEGNWASQSYDSNLQIKEASVVASAVVAGGQLEFSGNAQGLSAVCSDGGIDSVKTDQPTESVDVAYRKQVDENRTLNIASQLPKIDLNLERESNLLGVAFVDLVAAATRISVFEKGDEVVSIICGDARLSAQDSNVHGEIESIAVKLSNGAIAEFSDAIIDNLSEQGDGSISCVLQNSALPKPLREELGDASLTARKVFVKLERWDAKSLELQEFKASTSLTVIEQKAREAIEKKHAVENNDKYVSIDPVDIKLAALSLTPADEAIHVHLKGSASVSGTVKVRSDDLTELGKAVKAAADEAAKKAEQARKAAEEKGVQSVW